MVLFEGGRQPGFDLGRREAGGSEDRAQVGEDVVHCGALGYVCQQLCEFTGWSETTLSSSLGEGESKDSPSPGGLCSRKWQAASNLAWWSLIACAVLDRAVFRRDDDLTAPKVGSDESESESEESVEEQSERFCLVQTCD